MSRLKIEALANVHFGLHQDKSLAQLGHDFVVVFGENETGKSTISEFICWTIAGPWRSAADGSARFETKSGNKLSGRMIAELNSETLDIESSFTLLRSGKPNDARIATLGKRTIASGQISTILNQLTPDDYRWVYVVNGVDLSRSKTADDFSDLFSSFTTGLSTGGVNLREIMKDLEVQLKASDKAVKALNKQKKEIRESIADASRAPSRLNGLIQDKNDQDRNKDLIDEEIAAITAERSHIQFALRAIEAKGNLNSARFVLQGLDTVPSGWSSVLPLFGEICRLQNEIDRLDKLVENASNRVQAAMSKRNFEVSEVVGRTFTVDDRFKLRELFTEVMRNENRASSSVAEVSRLNSELVQVEESISGLLNVSGVEQGLIPFLRNQRPVMESLNLQGSLLESAAAESEIQRAVIAGLEAPQIPDFSAGTQINSPTGRSFLGVQFVASLAVVSAAAFLEPAAGVVAAVLAVAIFFLFGNRKPNSNSIASSSVASVSNVVSNLNNEQSKLASLLSKENDIQIKILEALKKFGVTSVSSVTVRPQIDRLVELSEYVDQKFSLEFAIASENKRFNEISVDLAGARVLLKDALRSIEVHVVPDSPEFETWLAGYEEAVNSNNQLSELSIELSEVIEKCKEYLAPVAETINELPWPVVESQFEHFVSLSASVSAAQSKLREAEIEFNAAGGGSLEVQILLDKYPSDLQLKTFDESLQEKLDGLSAARDEAIKVRTEKDQEISKINSEEILPSLNLEFSEIEEDLIEAQNQFQIDKIAFEVFEKVIERFEKDNQDPLIKEAQRYISEIVDQWGDLLFSRDDKGRVQIERDGQGGKLPQNSLSDGARALLFLGIRLAFVNKDAEKRGIRLPILCDDPFIHFDDSRRDAAMKLFGRISQINQVIMFTCEESTRDLAISNGAHLINL